MNKGSKEENSEGEPRMSKSPRNLFTDIDKVLQQLQSTYRTNLEAQESYLDILKRKNKNINSHYIKNLYTLFTENKANQICIDKQKDYLAGIINADKDERTLRRYYARLIETGMRKISYFWMNSNKLEFMSSYVVRFMREIFACFNDVTRCKNLDAHYTIVDLLFEETSIIEQRIYELLIDQGYLMSMDEFYRINGVDLVGDEQYEGKPAHAEAPIPSQSSESSIGSKNEAIKPMKFNVRKKQKQNKKIWGYTRSNPQPMTIPTKLQRDKEKIKNMMETMVTVLKDAVEMERENPLPLEIIQEQNVDYPEPDNPQIPSARQIKEVHPVRINKKKTTKTQSVMHSESRKRGQDKKMSIEYMNYFSSELKTALHLTQEPADIKFLSEMLMAQEADSNSLPIEVVGKNNTSQLINSIKSIHSSQKIRDQKKRGRFIEFSARKKHSQNISQLLDDASNRSVDQIVSDITKQKFSFKSAPGVFFTLPQKGNPRKSSENKKIDSGKNRFMIRQNFEKDQLFQNEQIINELTSQKAQELTHKVHLAEVNSNNFTMGVMGAQNLKALSQNMLRIVKEHYNGVIEKAELDKQNQQSFAYPNIKMMKTMSEHPFSIRPNQMLVLPSRDSKRLSVKNIQFDKPSQAILKFKATEQPRHQPNTESSERSPHQYNQQAVECRTSIRFNTRPLLRPYSQEQLKFNYAIYDRVRHRVILQKRA